MVDDKDKQIAKLKYDKNTLKTSLTIVVIGLICVGIAGFIEEVKFSKKMNKCNEISLNCANFCNAGQIKLSNSLYASINLTQLEEQVVKDE